MPAYGAPNSVTVFNQQPASSLPPNQGLTIGWREYISRTGSTQKFRWSNDAGAIEMIIDSAFNDRDDLVAETIGVPYVAGAKSLIMSRYLPMPHPDYFWMHATGFSMSGVNWQQKQTSGYGAFSDYDINRTYVTFTTLPYNAVLPDTHKLICSTQYPTDSDNNNMYVYGEQNRFCIVGRKPTTEFATVSQNLMKWPDGSTVPGGDVATPLSNIPGTKPAFAQSFGVKQSQTTITVKWFHVPENYLFNYNGQPVNIESALGKVNSMYWGFSDVQNSEFATGYPPQTLYFDAVDYEPVILPVNPRAAPPFGLGYPKFKPPRVWNVTFYFKYFNPPKDPGYTYTITLTGGKILRIGGHNLIPNVNQRIPNSTGYYYYPVISQVSGATLFQGVNFQQLFQPSTLLPST